MSLIQKTAKGYGYYFYYKAVGAIIVGSILIIVGIVLSIYGKSANALILSLLGPIAIIGGLYYRKRAKGAMSGDTKRILY